MSESTRRAIHSVTLTFGLVSIPMRVFTAATPEKASFNLITKTGSRTKQKWFDPTTNQEVQQADLLKGYEHKKGEYITFTRDELKVLESERTDAVEIKEFVNADFIDPILVEKSYYLGPDKGGDRGYLLLSSTLWEMDKIAIAQWSAFGRDQLVAIVPYKNGLAMHILFYATEVRDLEGIVPDSDKISVSQAEKSMAKLLVESLTTETTDLGKYKEGYQERVRKAVQAKLEGKEIIPEAEISTANPLDLLEALKASIETLKSGKKSK